jgi:hypothetical protein
VLLLLWLLDAAGAGRCWLLAAASAGCCCCCCCCCCCWVLLLLLRLLAAADSCWLLPLPLHWPEKKLAESCGTKPIQSVGLHF